MVGDQFPTYAQLLARSDAPAGSSWGVFSSTPERGMANFAGAEQVLAATALIRTGRVFSLDYALDAFDPPMARSRHAPVHEITSSHAQSRDDVVREFYPQASSQVDGLRHRRASGHGFYNGVPDDEIRSGSTALGVQRWAEDPIVGRGVVLDVAGLMADRGQALDHRAGPALPAAVLDEAAERQGVRFRPGDLVVVHTGWAHWYLTADGSARQEVRDARRSTGFAQQQELLGWLWDHRVAFLATDTYAVEVLPPRPDSPFRDSAPEDHGMMHQELLAKLGVAMGELWNLDALVADCRATGCWEAFVSIKPLHLTGGVGSPPNALAIR